MSKYIDAKKLIAEIKRQKHALELSIQSQGDYGQSCHIVAYEDILSLIDSLPKETPETINGKFVFPKFLYARTTDNKTMDVSYAPQSLDAIEYIRSDSLQQEQPEVDLDKEIEGYWVDAGWSKVITLGKFKHIARHFYELDRLNARKEE